MGNYLDFRSSSVSKERDKQPPPLNIPYKQSGVLSVDPRSPSEGIVRTPIQIDKGDPRSPSAGVVRTPLGFSTKLTGNKNFLISLTARWGRKYSFLGKLRNS
uniref:Uncharacterized protein n=1 Tax=Trichobilharzia regenti TaxID=157069 RepID=A0AA85KES7_TRIRE|nr:unnamed protein product [Trichobilharzia regenti]